MHEAGEMVLQLRALTVLAEDLGSIPSTNIAVNSHIPTDSCFNGSSDLQWAAEPNVADIHVGKTFIHKNN